MAKKKNYKDTLNEISQILESQGIKSSNEEIAQKYANRQDVQLRDTTSKANKWLNTGAFKDGYQFGDVSKSIMGTAQNIQQNINKGAFSTAEGILDLGSNLVGMGAEAIGQNKFGKKAKEFAQKDIASILFPDTKLQRENTVLGGKSQNIAQGVGQVGSTIALGILTGGSSLATTGAIGLSATGSGINEALQGGATNDEAVKYGLISGLAEAGSEMLFGGLAKGVNVLGVGKGLSSVDDMLAKKVSSLFESHLAKNLSQYAIKASGEGLEEVISGFAQAIGKKLTYMKDEDLAKLIQDEQLLDQFIAGTVTAGITQVPGLVKVTNQGRDYVTGNTDIEQRVADKEIENRINEQEVDGKKLTQKEKDRVYDQVKKDLQRGYVGTDTIENALGYNEIVNKMVTDTENAMGKNVTKEELADIQQEARERIQDAIKDDEYLQESYNEKARKSQNYTNDLSKYSKTQQKTIQKAIDSGILNNTNRTHDFVDMIAKISEDKGVDFDFTNNEKLKNSNFSVNGDINGYVDNGTITLNTDSKKSLNSVVGHEITHVLEGTELYDSLKQAVKEYATAKGEYDTRLAKLNELYNGVKNANVENELTSDIIGDYLFTDEDFINTLSTKHRNIFQKIYDEIKYLIKTVTAGSNEERELLKVKKAFDKAYKQKPVQQQDIKLSMNEKITTQDNQGRELSKQQQEYFKDSKVRDGEGRLLEVYHGTGETFTKFEKDFIGSNYLQDEKGFFFTDDINQAQEYANYTNYGMPRKNPGNVMKEYLNITNPYIVNIDYDPISYWDENYNNILKNVDKNGNDGIIIKAQKYQSMYIAFEPNQIKNVDNTNPTDNPDIRFSLSEETDSKGNNISIGQQEYFRNSKVRDNDGKLITLYHGTPNEFTIFDTKNFGGKNGTAEGFGIYLTDNIDVADDYLQQGKGKVMELYANITKPATTDDLTTNKQDVIKAIKELTTMEAQQMVDDGEYDTINDALKDTWISNYTYTYDKSIEDSYNDVAKEVLENSENDYEVVQELMNGSGNNDYKRASDFYNIITNTLGFDGIKTKWNFTDNDLKNKNADIWLAFNSNQVKNTDNLNPTENEDIRYSLGQQTPTGSYNVTGEDVRLQEAPIEQVNTSIQELTNKINELQQQISEMGRPTQNADEQAITQQYEEAPMNEVAPIRENLTKDESEDLDMLEDYFNRYKENNDIKNDEELAIDIQFASDGDKQLYSMYKDLQEKESGYYEQETADDEIVSRGLDDRELGKRKVKAYQYEHPEVKPYFQQEAKALLSELNESTFGERTFDSETYYNTDGEYGWNGTKRNTSDSLARFKDNNNYTWEEIREGLNAIIEDNGEENNAVSKKLEVLIDDRLRNGYKNFGTEGVFLGKRTEPNQEYIRLLNEIQRQEALSEIPFAEEDTSENMDIFDPRSKAISEARKERNRYEIALALKDATGLEKNLQNRVDEIKAKINDTRTPLETIVNNNLTKKLGTEPQHIEPRKKSSLRNFIDNAKRLFINENAEVDNIAREYKAPQLKYNFDMLNNAFAEGQNDIDVAQTDNYGKAIGKSVNQLFQPAIDSGLYDAFNDYLINYSNIDRHNQGKGSQTPLDVSENLVKAYEKSYPEFKEWAKDVWNYGKNTRDNMLEAGLIDEGLYNALGEMYPHYVPYISDVENINGLMQDVGEVKPRGLKKAYGKAGKVLPVQEALSKYTYSMKRGIRQNNAFNQLIDTLGTAEQGTDDRTDYTNLDSGLYRDRNGAFVTAYKDGNARSIRITDDLYKSLKNDLKTSVQNIEEQLSLITKPLQKLSNIRRNILTSWSPTFPIKNALKDFQGALFNSKHTAKMLKNYPSAIKELSKMNTPEVRQFTALYGSGNLMGQFDEKSYKSLGKNKFLRGISKANEVIELAPRYAEFKASIESGASLEEAMYNAREVTTNFSRGGTITKALNRNGFTFLNSSVQGFDKFIRNFSGENGAKGVASALLKAVMFGVAPALFNDLVFGSGDDKDEDYEALPDYIKDNYYLIKTGDNQFVRIPKGREFSVFGSAARRTLEALGGEEDAFNGYLKNAWEQIGIGDLEQNNIIAPLLQAYGSKEGKAWYGGDIIPTRLQDKPAEEQYDASTDKLSVWLGQQLGISPYKLNYVIDQYTGGIGDIVLPLITPEATSEGSIFAPITDQFTSNSTMKNKYASDFYTKLDELKVKNNSVNASDEDSIMYKYMNSVSGEMSQLYKEKREVQESDLPKDEKFAKVQSIQEQINSLAKEGLENYKNYTVSNGYAEVNGTDYYKNDEGKWTKAKQDTSNTLNSYGLDTQEKSTFFNTQTEISNIKKSNEDYATKKSNVIDTIVNSNLTDDSKVLLYTENYKDNDINDLMEVGINVDSYLTYKGQNFTADKDSNGKSINGSKKNKVFNYINQMNIPFEEKCILAKLEYNSYNEYNNEIINYLNNNSNVDYETMKELLTNMGFKVDANGNIKW